MNEQEKKRVKVILINGFQYKGIELEGDKLFYKILDDKDNNVKRIPYTSISLIEPLHNGGSGNDR